MDKFDNMRDGEVSPGGSRIHVHKERDAADVRMPHEHTGYMDEICAHFDKLFPGRKTMVYHEIASELVHVDVHLMYPTKDENFYVLYTTGMSTFPMTMPEGMTEQERMLYERAEIFMYLPGFDGDDFIDMWAVNWLQYFARMPHEFGTWLGDGHTIPNGPNYTPILPNSPLSCALIVGMGGDFSPVITKDGAEINLLMLTPISKAETEFKLEKGMGALMGLFEKQGVPMVVNAFRSSLL